MANPIIKIKRSAVPGKIPTTTSLELGELAINTYDGKVYIEQDQGGVGVGTTVITINPWSVGTGTNTYNTYFTAGNVGVGTTNPTEKLSVSGKIQINQLADSSSRLIFRAKPGNFYRWNIDNDSSEIFRIFSEDDATAANGAVRLSISTTGTVSAARFSGDGSLLTGITASGTGILIQNQGSNVGTAGTINFSTNLNASFASGTATVTLSNNPSISGILTADQVYTSNNGNGTNIRIGDDLWLGDINVANTTRFSGAQNSDRAFIVFGNSDTVSLGRTGTGPLYYGGNLNVAGVVTASSFSGSGANLTGIVASYATSSGIATYATTAGIATYATSSGIATYATTAGVSTYATSSGIATYATSSGIATYATSSGIATYATNSGVSTSVIGGIGSITQLQVTGISTFTNGPVLVGSATSTGTASQALQVTGGGYVSGSLGIGSTLPTSKLSVVGDGRFTGVVTATSFYGDGSGLTGIVASGIATVQIRESAPLSSTTGDLWYNSGLGRLFIYYTDDNSSQWVDVAPFNGTNSSGVTVSSLAPASPEEGDLWFSTVKGRLFIYYNDGDSSQWIDAAPFNQSEPSTIEFPTGDYGDFTSSADAFGQTTSGITYDCLAYPSASLATYDLGTI